MSLFFYNFYHFFYSFIWLLFSTKNNFKHNEKKIIKLIVFRYFYLKKKWIRFFFYMISVFVYSARSILICIMIFICIFFLLAIAMHPRTIINNIITSMIRPEISMMDTMNTLSKYKPKLLLVYGFGLTIFLYNTFIIIYDSV